MVKPGIVYLIGAGPGDPGLVTLKAQELVRRADVLLYDRLIDDTLLAEAGFDAPKHLRHAAGWEHSAEPAT